MDKNQLKNVKISDHIHTQIKTISEETGVNVGKLIEMGAQKIIESYKGGMFDTLVVSHKKIRKDGAIARS